MRDGLIDEALVGGDKILCGRGDIVDANLLRDLGPDGALIGLVDGVKLQVDRDLAATVDEIGKSEIDIVERLFRGADDQSPGTFFDSELFDIEDVADDIAELVHLHVSHPRDVDCLLQQMLESLMIFRGGFCDENAVRVERDGHQVDHVEQDRDGALIGYVFEVESKILPLDGFVEAGPDAVCGEDLAEDILFVGDKVKAFGCGVGQKSDGTGDGRGVAYPGLYLRPKDLRA